MYGVLPVKLVLRCLISVNDDRGTCISLALCTLQLLDEPLALLAKVQADAVDALSGARSQVDRSIDTFTDRTKQIR